MQTFENAIANPFEDIGVRRKVTENKNKIENRTIRIYMQTIPTECYIFVRKHETTESTC